MNGTIDGYANVTVNNGKLLLNAANTYVGTTTVNAGTLGGTGTINGAVTIADLARLADAGKIADLKTMFLIEALRRRRPALFV